MKFEDIYNWNLKNYINSFSDNEAIKSYLCAMYGVDKEYIKTK